MPVPSAVSSLATSFELMRDLLASSQYWQMSCLMPGATFEAVKAAVDANRANATTLAAAKVRIVGDLMPEEMIGDDEGCMLVPPRSLLRYQQDASIERTTTSGTNRTDGIVFSIELPVPEQYCRRDPELLTSGYMDHLNKIGKIIEDMQASVIAGGSIQIDRWQRVEMGMIQPEEIGGQWVRFSEHIATFTGVC